MHIILEYAECTLFDILAVQLTQLIRADMRNSLTLSQFRSVLFQVLLALHVAQTELEFNHNDLHLKSIL